MRFAYFLPRHPFSLRSVSPCGDGKVSEQGPCPQESRPKPAMVNVRHDPSHITKPCEGRPRLFRIPAASSRHRRSPTSASYPDRRSVSSPVSFESEYYVCHPPQNHSTSSLKASSYPRGFPSERHLALPTSLHRLTSRPHWVSHRRSEFDLSRTERRSFPFGAVVSTLGLFLKLTLLQAHHELGGLGCRGGVKHTA